MRRQDRAQELLYDAQPWDLIVVDEAHHARRKGGGVGTDDRPNQLLRLMQRLKDHTQGLILLTATPMQVSPIEVWDLLSLFGLPREWHADAFLRFFEYISQTLPGDKEMAAMAAMFRAMERDYGPVSDFILLYQLDSQKSLHRWLYLLVMIEGQPGNYNFTLSY